jgi:hypothetical protein
MSPVLFFAYKSQPDVVQYVIAFKFSIRLESGIIPIMNMGSAYFEPSGISTFFMASGFIISPSG